MKIVFVSNYAPHYRIRLFEYLHNKLDIQFYFYSKGEEWYWQKEHGVYSGDFRHEYLSGFRIRNTSINLSLIKRFLQTKFDVYIKCINGRFALPVTFLAAKINHKPFILWTGIWFKVQTPAHKVFFPITRYIYQNSAAVVVYGNHVKRFLIQNGVKENQIFLAPQAVDNDAYSVNVSEQEKKKLINDLGIKPNDKVILCIGRLVKSKGIYELIQAFSDMEDKTNLILLIVGTGPEREGLIRYSADLGISHQIKFINYIKTNQTVPYYAISYISVLNSFTTPTMKEPWGLTINEGFNQGVPVIVSDAVGAAADGFVKDGFNGMVIPENDLFSLTKALECITSDEKLRDEMGQNARETVRNQDYERMASGFLQAIDYVTIKNGT